MPGDAQVVVLGAGFVGKSSLTIQFVQGHFVDKYDSTIEDIYSKPMEVDDTPVVVSVLDTAGQDAFATMREQYLKAGQIFVIMYSITDAESFAYARRMMTELRRVRGRPLGQSLSRGSSRSVERSGDVDGDAESASSLFAATSSLGSGPSGSMAASPSIQPYVGVLVGNKIDLEAQRTVETHEGAAAAEEAGLAFFEITARDRLAVERVVCEGVRMLWNEGRLPEVPGSGPAASGVISPRTPSSGGASPVGRRRKKKWYDGCVML